jgi:kynureninase
MNQRIHQAVASLGDAPLSESAIERHIAPLFSRALAPDRIYLANHSLGRPLDAMAEDIAEATALWYDRLGDAWDPWLEEREAFRARIAALIGAPRPDCVVPKTSAGQGLRTVLNALPGKPRVVTTRGEFDSIDVILKQYAALGRIELHWIEADSTGNFSVEPLIEALGGAADLVVVSQVMFMTGQIIDGLDHLAHACHRHGVRLFIDSYHAIGVIPVSAARLDCDFMVGGSYKYLRGGPGACFLYISPSALDSGLRPLDTGWFANSDEFAYQRPDQPVLKPGGDAFLESTPPILTWYQARSGQEFTLTMGVERLRAYSLHQLGALREYLADAGVDSVIGGDTSHGAFLAIRAASATQLPPRLQEQGIIADARGDWLRLCPDCLTRDEELRRAAVALKNLLRSKR